MKTTAPLKIGLFEVACMVAVCTALVAGSFGDVNLTLIFIVAMLIAVLAVLRDFWRWLWSSDEDRWSRPPLR